MNQFGVGLHLSENSRESAGKLRLVGEVAIVGSVLPGVLPCHNLPSDLTPGSTPAVGVLPTNGDWH